MNPEELDLAFGILTVLSFGATFLLYLFVVACGTVYVWADARARGKTLLQALIWSAASALVAPFGFFLYLAVHSRQGDSEVTPPLVSLRGLIVLSLFFMTLFFVINPSIALPVTNQGSSMEPTLEEGDRLVGDRFSIRFGALRRGDVVLLRDVEGDILVKRLIGLPGETIHVERGITRINETVLDEEYLMVPPRYYLPTLRIPDDTYYVLGDNRNISVDSHFFGPVPRANVIAKVRYRFWPLSRISIVK